MLPAFLSEFLRSATLPGADVAPAGPVSGRLFQKVIHDGNIAGIQHDHVAAAILRQPSGSAEGLTTGFPDDDLASFPSQLTKEQERLNRL